MYHHRSGSLRQENKSHKRGDASKRALDKANHGRIEKPAGGAAGAPKKHGAKHIPIAEVARASRVNHAKQLRDAKKAESMLMRRLGGGAYGPARNVAIISLSAAASPLGAAALLLDMADGVTMPVVPPGFPAPLVATYKAFRQDVLISLPPRGGQIGPAPGAPAGASDPAVGAAWIRYDVTHTLAAVRGADVVVLVVDVSPTALAATAASLAAAEKMVQVPLPLTASSTTAAAGGPGGARRGSAAGGAAIDDDAEGSVGGSEVTRGAASGAASVAVGAAATSGLVDAEGELFLACLKASGVPSIVGLVQGLDAYSNAAKAGEARKVAQRLFATEFGEDIARLVEAADPLVYVPPAAGAGGSAAAVPVAIAGSARTSGSGLHLCRAVCSVAPRTVHWRAARSYMTAQGLHWEPNPAGAAAGDGVEAGAPAAAPDAGTLSVFGYLKGRPFNVHQLVTLPWGGAYQVLDVAAARDCFRKPPHGAPLAQPAAAATAAAGAVADKGATGAHAHGGLDFGSPGTPFTPLSATALPALPSIAAKTRLVSAADLLMPPTAAAAAHRAAGVAGAGMEGEEGAAAGEGPLLAAARPELRESLEAVAPPEEDEDGEQNLAGFEDDEEGEGEGMGSHDAGSKAGSRKGGKGGKRRPAGMSRYQASWLVEGDGEEDGEGSEEGEGAAEELDHTPGGMEGAEDSEEGEGGSGNGSGAEEDEEGEDDEDVYAEGALDPKDPEALRRIRERRAAQRAADEAGRQAMKLRRRRRKLEAAGGSAADGADGAGTGASSAAVAAAAAAALLPDGYVPTDALEEAGSGDEDDASSEGGVSGKGAHRSARSATRSVAGGSAASGPALSAAEDWLRRRRAAAADELLWPDETDTPTQQPARERFQRYRGLKSMRSSPWDPKESLPTAYGRIYGLPHFQRAQARILGESALAERALLTLEMDAAEAARSHKRETAAAAKGKRLADRRAASMAGSVAGSAAGVGSGAGAAEVEMGGAVGHDSDGEEGTDASDDEASGEGGGMDVDAAGAGAGAGAAGGKKQQQRGGKGKARQAPSSNSAAIAAAAAAGGLSTGAGRGGVGGSSSAASTAGGPAGTVATAAPTVAGTQGLQEVLGEGWVAPGAFVCLRLANVPLSALQDAAASGGCGAPLTLFSLLRHEAKASVMHFSLTRTDTYGEPIAAKEQLELHVGGHRLFDVRPIYSSGGAGSISASGGRGRAEKFLQGGGRVATATAYAPICYAPCPVLAFKRIPLDPEVAAVGGQTVTASAIARAAGGGEGAALPSSAASAAGGAAALASACEPLPLLYPAPDRLNVAAACGPRYRLVLVAAGSVLGADPDRLVLKRVVLTGYPTRIKVRSATIKYLFFNPGDVEYWKPVELYTKHGLVGNVTEPLGTHGLLKAHFDKPLKQHDTVCMPLYKRVYPRWGDCFAAAVGVAPGGGAGSGLSRGLKGAHSKRGAAAKRRAAAAGRALMDGDEEGEEEEQGEDLDEL